MIQHLPANLHWALSDSLLLKAINEGKPVVRGRAGSIAGIIIRFCHGIGLHYPVILMIGTAEMAKLLLSQHAGSGRVLHAGVAGAENHASRYFVGFGAGREDELFNKYGESGTSDVVRLDETRVATFGAWHKVGFGKACASLFSRMKSAIAAIDHLPAGLAAYKTDFLVYIATRLGHTSYFSAWFQWLASSGQPVAELCFISASMPAFAAVDCRLPTRYLQHGFIRHSIVWPGFAAVEAITADEAMHFARRIPRAMVSSVSKAHRHLIQQVPRTLLVASIYGPPAAKKGIGQFLHYMSGLGFDIHVRPHPREDTGFWKTSAFPFALRIDGHDASFEAALARVRPVLVVSWFSTALVDCLNHGIIPVTLSARDDPDVADMVYPLFRRALHWPDEGNEIESVTASDSAYQSVIEKLSAGL